MARAVSHQGQPACRAIADKALTIASVEPTDRSMPPVVMTRVIATAAISVGALWRSTLSMLACVRKLSVVSAK